MTSKTLTERCWDAYQLGQVSADHTAKEVFIEVIGPLENEIERLFSAVKDTDRFIQKQIKEERKAADALIAAKQVEIERLRAELADERQNNKFANEEIGRLLTEIKNLKPRD